MRLFGSHAGKCLFAALFALGASAAALGCDAEVETVCHAGPCQGTGGGTGGSTTSAGGTGGSGGAGGTGGTMCSGDPESGDIPCDVHAILEANCLTCHNENHVMGAPIDLLACERFHEIDCDDVKTRFQKARDYVESDFMPLGTDLTPADKQTLLDWLDACAPCQPAGMGCGAPPAAKACYE